MLSSPITPMEQTKIYLLLARSSEFIRSMNQSLSEARRKINVNRKQSNAAFRTKLEACAHYDENEEASYPAEAVVVHTSGFVTPRSF